MLSTLESEVKPSADGVSLDQDPSQISQVSMTEGAPVVRVNVSNVLTLEKKDECYRSRSIKDAPLFLTQ